MNKNAASNCARMIPTKLSYKNLNKLVNLFSRSKTAKLPIQKLEDILGKIKYISQRHKKKQFSFKTNKNNYDT